MGRIAESRLSLIGVTGLLGQELITELASGWPNAQIDIFARPSAQASGRRRAREAARSALGTDDFGSRINFHAADLSLPSLGLDPTGRAALLDADHVVNAAADVSFGMPLAVARRRNVETLENLLNFVNVTRPFMHYVSTAYVGHGEGVVGPLPPSLSTDFRNTYEQSKAEAEALLATCDCLWRVYRPSIIVGSARDGRAKSYDTVYVFARALMSGRMPAVPAERAHKLDIVPSDYVARAIRRLIEVGEPRRAYHITAGLESSPQVADLVGSLHEVLDSIEHPAAELTNPHVLRMLSPAWFDGLLQLPVKVAPSRLRAAAETARTFLPFVRDDVPSFDPSETERLIGERPPSFSEYGSRLWRSAVEDNFGRASGVLGRCRAVPDDSRSLADLVRRSARMNPHGLALHAQGRRYTFDELQELVTDVTSKLHCLGVAAGDRIAVMPEQRVPDLVLILAAMAIDAHLTLLPVGADAESIGNSTVVSVNHDLTLTSTGVVKQQCGKPGLVIATSGTTGPPKWVHHENSSIARCGVATARRLSVDSGQKVAIFLPLYHAFAMCVAIPAAWSHGAAVALSSDLDGPSLGNISESEATHVVGVMEHFQKLIDEMDKCISEQVPDISSWEVALCGDDPILPAVWERFEAVFRRPMAQGYGLTECLLTAVGVTPSPAAEGMVVRPIPDVHVEVRDTNGVVVQDGVVGEVWIDAPWRMTGFADEPALPSGPVPTGDYGRVDSEGNLHIRGRRLSGLGITEGCRPDWDEGPSSIEIEDVLIQDDRVHRVRVVWRECQALAFVEPRVGASIPDRMVVIGVNVLLVPMDRLPRTDVGKVSRRALAGQATIA